jgi:hypothetical protein
MTARNTIKLSSILVVAIVAFAAPARADRCDDLAKQLAGQMPGMKVGATRAGEISLSHPAVTQASLGCSSRNRYNSMTATTDKKKPTDAYYAFIAQASALVFTITKDDTLRGTRRCVSRTNIFRGYDISSRYRKLDIHCTVSKAGVRITVAREKDE